MTASAAAISRTAARVTDRRLLVAALALGGGWTALGFLVERSGRVLGTATPPLVMGWAPRVSVPWSVAAATALALLIVAGPVAADRLRAPAFAAALYGLALAAGLALNAARGGTHGWYAIFDAGPSGSFEAKNEYLPGVPALSYGRHFFLDRFAELVPALPVNVAGHPPGLLLSADALGLTTPRAFAALCIASAAACAPLTYVLARQFVAEPRARIAGLLAAASPGLLLFGVTSADAVYAALGTAAAALLVRPRWRARGTGAVVLALAAFYSWALLAIGAFAVVVAWQREGARRAVQLAAACAAAVFALNAALAALYGYDPIGTLHATDAVYRNSLARVRPYWFWLLGSPIAWMASAGLALSGAWIVAIRRRAPAAVALAVVAVTAAVLGFTKAETERIWLPFVPLACVAASSVVPRRAVRPLLVALAAQALLVQLLFETVW